MIFLQKTHRKGGFLNGGAEKFDGVRVLRPAVSGLRNSLFIRQLTGKNRHRPIYPLDFGTMLIYVPSSKKIAAEISANSLRREAGKEQGKISAI